MLRARRSALAARLLLDLADQARAVVAQLVLQLAHHHLLRLAGAEAGQPLQLAQLVALRALQLLARVLEVARAIGEYTLALVQLLRLELDRPLLGAQALLEPGQLGATDLELVLQVAGALRLDAAEPPPLTAIGAEGRRWPAARRAAAASNATDTATAAATAPPTRCPFCVSLCPGAARAGSRQFRAVSSAPRDTRYDPPKRRARLGQARAISSMDPPDTPSKSVRCGHLRKRR